jgi:serine/threonine protein kinase
MDVETSEIVLKVTLHETYELSKLIPSHEWLKSHRNKWQVRDISGLIALALACGITIFNDSANSSFDRIDSTKGLSSTIRIFNMRPGYAAIGRQNEEGRSVVSKHLSKAVIEDESRRFDAVVREMIILSHPPVAAHASIVDLIGIGWEDFADYEAGLMWPVSIIEFAPYGSVQDFLLSCRFALDFPHLKALCGDIADALAWLHACGIVHSDIKCENAIIIVSEEERSIPGFHFNAKLCDFGFALDTNALSELGLQRAWLNGYTPPWQPPEADEEIDIDLLPAVDVYCYGMFAARVFLKGGHPLDSCLPSLSLPTNCDVQTLVSELHKVDLMPAQLEQRCRATQSYNTEDTAFLANLFRMTTQTQSAARASMVQIRDFLTGPPSLNL